MARKCPLTGKEAQNGCRVSHAHNRSKHSFRVNIVKRKRFWVASQGRYITLKLSTAAIRLIDKIGIEAALARLQD